MVGGSEEMRRAYKNIEEVKAVFPDAKIYEYESCFMIEEGKTVSVVPKALSKEKIYTTMLSNGFPEKYLKVIFNEIVETEALKKVKEAKKKGIILDGKPGVGKSIACTWKIAKLLQHREISNPLYISCVAFPDLKTLYNTYKEYDCFMIDDLIATLPQPRLELIVEILYFAELQERYLFITSNSFTDLAKALPEALLSRLRSYCEFHKIKENKDLRLQNTS
jgi:DNA replication protein DnaC